MSGPRNSLVVPVVVASALAVGGAVAWWVTRPGPVVAPVGAGGQGEGTSAGVDARVARGRELYGRSCAGCHGEQGDGRGPAAVFLYPRPRDFGEARFRLVSTSNGMPSDEDLRHAIRHGMPGSAMPPFAHLGEEDVAALAGHVRGLIRSGIEGRLQASAREARQEVDPEVLEEQVERLTRVGGPVEVPSPWPAADAGSLARGAQVYKTKGCASCHGDTGKGDGVQAQKNSDGMPTRPRDFTRGIFKGGREPAQMFARVRAGMPGSPMPSSDGLSTAEVTDLVNYVLSLPAAGSWESFEPKRQKVVARRVEALPADIPDSVWSSAEGKPVVVTPLWWRDDPPADLRVAAVHDGKELAVRLTWQDGSRDAESGRVEQFEDMAAVELVRPAVGQTEPFLGMGAVEQGVDLWLWRAGWPRGATAQAGAAAAGEAGPLDEYPFEGALYRKLTAGKEKGTPDFVTARAAGNPIAAADPAQTAGHLAAKGFGSTTFRPKASQRVTARAAWRDGRWAVVLRRPLEVGADDGLSLKPKEPCSVAFALWDGAARDRAAQKRVSVWNDLELAE